MSYALETHTGIYLDFALPARDQICLEDLARAMSMTSRFGGHVERFVSIAEHSIWVSKTVERWGGSMNLAFAALHHDSHETYTGDIPSPLKAYIKDHAPGVWEALIGGLDTAIGRKFGIDPELFHDDMVKEADILSMRIEAAFVKRSRGIGSYWGWDDLPPEIGQGARPKFYTPEQAETMFLSRHWELQMATGRATS